MSVTLLQPPRSSVWRFEHRLATSDTLASVMFSQLLRLSVWRFEHRLATSVTLASVMFLQLLRLSVWRFGHPLATSNKLASVMFSPERSGVWRKRSASFVGGEGVVQMISVWFWRKVKFLQN